ncbi:MAG: tetratricopeptide repeat protein [Clostridiaceae bacterium]
MKFFEKANELYKNQNFKDAIDFYKKSYLFEDNKSSSLYNQGVCHIKLKEYEDAIPCLKKAIELKKESKYYFNLGYAYAMLNTKDKALIYFNLAWSYDNNDKDCERAINIILKTYKTG